MNSPRFVPMSSTTVRAIVSRSFDTPAGAGASDGGRKLSGGSAGVKRNAGMAGESRVGEWAGTRRVAKRARQISAGKETAGEGLPAGLDPGFL
jgi:hypothetical protein